jgi:hypothetical protein
VQLIHGGRKELSRLAGGHREAAWPLLRRVRRTLICARGWQVLSAWLLFQTILEPVSQAHSLVCFTCPLIRGTCTVPAEHLPALPTSKPHEVLFLATFREPAVGERVAEHMRMQVVKACLRRAPSEHLTYAVISHHAASTKAKVRCFAQADACFVL